MSRQTLFVRLSARLLGGRRFALATIIGVLAAIGAAEAQTSERTSVPANVLSAQDFLFAAYPDLIERPLIVQLREENGLLLLSVSEAPASAQPAEPATPAPSSSVLLRAAMAFDTRGRLAGYEANGPYLNDGANALLRNAVRNHPAWIPSDADVELMRLGGAATTSTVFAPAAHPEAARVRRHLGTTVTADPAAFVLRGARPDGGTTPVVTAAWVVEATAEDSGGAVRYQFAYEPVGGRLIGVTKIGGAR